VPRGVDLFDDIRLHLPNLRVEVVFDVGANLGQSARRYLNEFSGSSIYCFEPVEATFLLLQGNLCGRNNIHCFKLALSSAGGTAEMVLEGSSDLFFLPKESSGTQFHNASRLEEVELETLDGFCAHRKIERINFLKIDTEGNDLEVLKGAEEMLSQHRIDVVEVEAGMNSKNQRHVPFGDFDKYFEDRNYYLFGIYDQMHEWPTKQPHLRRSNLVFISEESIKANPKR
jgi:FkbM family methyltransferase